MGDDERRLIDRRVGELRLAAESEGWEFRIVEESFTHVDYETRSSERSAWRWIVVSVDDRGDARVEDQSSVRRETAGEPIDSAAAEANWIADHGDLIDALQEGNHSLRFTNRHNGDRWVTGARCQHCTLKYTGDRSNPLVKKLSPDRPCEASAAKAEWIVDHSYLAAPLREAGHSLGFTTTWSSGSSQGGGRWSTNMYCKRCGAKYRGRLLSGRWGLSPKRSCKGNEG